MICSYVCALAKRFGMPLPMLCQTSGRGTHRRQTLPVTTHNNEDSPVCYTQHMTSVVVTQPIQLFTVFRNTRTTAGNLLTWMAGGGDITGFRHFSSQVCTAGHASPVIRHQIVCYTCLHTNSSFMFYCSKHRHAGKFHAGLPSNSMSPSFR